MSTDRFVKVVRQRPIQDQYERFQPVKEFLAPLFTADCRSQARGIDVGVKVKVIRKRTPSVNRRQLTWNKTDTAKLSPSVGWSTFLGTQSIQHRHIQGLHLHDQCIAVFEKCMRSWLTWVKTGHEQFQMARHSIHCSFLSCTIHKYINNNH